jgi:Protein of unknown function (DUF4012)
MARHRRRRKGWLVAGVVGGVIVVVLVVAAALAFRTYQHVKGPLQSVQATLTALAHDPTSLNSAAGRDLMENNLAVASREIASAQGQIDGSVGLKILGVVPGLHTQRSGLVQLVADLHATTVSAMALLHSVNTLAADSHGTDIALPQLTDLGTELDTVHSQLSVEDRPASGLWGPLGTYRQKFDREDVRAVHLLAQGEELTRYALAFLGADGPRNYLVMGENNAEMRDEGAPLSYSVMNTSSGAITVSSGQSVGDLGLSAPAPGIAVPAGTQAVFGELDPTEIWQSTNATADFSFSGRDMQAMYAAATGAHVDGVIGIDVVALQGLLALTGPVSVSGIPEPVTSANAANILLDQLYEGLPPNSSQGLRREELAAVTSAVFQQLRTGKVDVVALARTLATEVAGRHLQLWDENPQYEQILRDVGASGDIDTDDPTRTFHVAVENATATKLDYFVTVAISDTVIVFPDGDAEVDTSVTLTNHAPAGQPPSYQLGPDGVNSHVSGEYVGRVFLWGPRGAKQEKSVKESGLLLAGEVDLPVLAGKSATAQFETTIPKAVQGGRLRLVFVPQPRLAPESLSVHVIGHGLQKGTPTTVSASLTKTTALSWEFS